MHSQGIADGTRITELNIDAMADGQIYNKHQVMCMNVNLYMEEFHRQACC